MKIMFKNVIKFITTGKPKKVVTISTDLFESTISKHLSDIQNNNPECSIGSYPYYNYIKKSGGVNIVISSWTLDRLDNISKEIKEIIIKFGGKI